MRNLFSRNYWENSKIPTIAMASLVNDFLIIFRQWGSAIFYTFSIFFRAYFVPMPLLIREKKKQIIIITRSQTRKKTRSYERNCLKESSRQLKCQQQPGNPAWNRRQRKPKHFNHEFHFFRVFSFWTGNTIGETKVAIISYGSQQKPRPFETFAASRP